MVRADLVLRVAKKTKTRIKDPRPKQQKIFCDNIIIDDGFVYDFTRINYHCDIKPTISLKKK